VLINSSDRQPNHFGRRTRTAVFDRRQVPY